jgi:hypothetical protein
VGIERLSPYPLDPNAAGPSSLELSKLADVVLAPLLASADEAWDRLVFVDASRAKPHHAEVWRMVLMRLNERRNAIAGALAAPLTIIVAPLLDALIRQLGHDPDAPPFT